MLVLYWEIEIGAEKSRAGYDSPMGKVRSVSGLGCSLGDDRYRKDPLMRAEPPAGMTCSGQTCNGSRENCEWGEGGFVTRALMAGTLRALCALLEAARPCDLGARIINARW